MKQCLPMREHGCAHAEGADACWEDFLVIVSTRVPRGETDVQKSLTGTYAQGRGPLSMLSATVYFMRRKFPNIPRTVINHDVQINQRNHGFTRRRDNSRLWWPLEVIEKRNDQHTGGHSQRAEDEEGAAAITLGDEEDEEGACLYQFSRSVYKWAME